MAQPAHRHRTLEHGVVTLGVYGKRGQVLDGSGALVHQTDECADRWAAVDAAATWVRALPGYRGPVEERARGR